jgi:protease-4
MDTPTPSNDYAQPVHPQMVYEPVPRPPRQKAHWLLRIAVALLVVALFGSMMMNATLLAVIAGTAGDGEGRVQEKFISHNRGGTQKVAIFSIEGTILSGEGFFRQQIDHAKKDIEEGNLKAIVLRVNSPGGTISGSDYMFYHLRKLANEKHIPIVVSMGAVAASGGYYVSMCVGDKPDTIYAEPSTWTGSIGVIIPHYNVASLMEKWGIQDDAVASDPLKTMGSIARKMTPKERDIFQGLVNEGFTQFKNVIKQGRPTFAKDPTALDKLATGQVFTAEQAQKSGLIDKIGFVEDAVDRAIELAKLDKEQVKVVKYKAEGKLSDILFGQSRMQPSFDLAALLNSTSPQAYYLCSWLPALAASNRQ